MRKDNQKERKQKIKEEKPKRAENEMSDLEYEADLNYLKRLKQISFSWQKSDAIQSDVIGSLQRLLISTKELLFLRRQLVDIKMLIRIFQERQMQAELNMMNTGYRNIEPIYFEIPSPIIRESQVHQAQVIVVGSVQPEQSLSRQQVREETQKNEQDPEQSPERYTNNNHENNQNQ